MKKTKITNTLKGWKNTSMVMLMLLGFFSNVSGQALTCNNNVQVSVDANCQAVVTPDMILEGTYDLADYTVSINGGGNIVNVSMVGLTLDVTVTGPTGNHCWGTISVEDKIAPAITCSDVEISCDEALPAAPTATDGCGNATVTMVSEMIVDSGCTGAYSEIITRVWEATDASGNTAQCTQIISRQRGTLAGIGFPGNVTTDCANNENDVYQNTDDTNAYTYTTNATLLGKLVSGEPTGVSCGDIVISKVDEVVVICEGSYKVLRHWTAVDWCAPVGNNTMTATQIVKILDGTGPTVTAPATLVVGTTSNSCAGNVFLPNVIATDDCSSVNPASFSLVGAAIPNGILTNAPLGSHTIDYTVEDACGNATTGSFEIQIIDNIAPLAICDEFTQLGIGSDGTSVVPANVFDDGSYDNCGIVKMDVRRMNDPCHFDVDGNPAPELGWKDAAEFCCADIGTTVMVEFRITDAAGNTNSCMVEVLVEDKIAPQIFCPADKTINCTDDYTDLNLTGDATASDNCSSVTPTFIDSPNIDDCGEGFVNRIWSVTDDAGNPASCVQKITITNSDPFFICDTEDRTTAALSIADGGCAIGHATDDDVEWPADIELNTCGLGLEPADLLPNYPLDARPIVTPSTCGTIAVTKDDLTLQVQGDACLKIIRTWTIIDWCQYDVNNPTAGGRWDFVQVIKVVNSQAPTVNCENSDSYIQNFEAQCGSTFVNLFIDANDDCTPQADLNYSYSVENGNGTVIQTGNTNNASDAFNNGSYKVTWSVSDGCGNTQVCTHDFTVVDAKKPTPVCLNGLATVIMPSSGAVTLWASDFESGSSFDNCTPHDQLQFSFSSDVTNTNMEFNCNSIVGGSTIPVEIWVTDGSGNQDFCLTYIQVQDSNGACGPVSSTGTIEPAGAIQTEEELDVEDVTVNLDGSIMTALTTGANGQFTFGSMPTPSTGAYIVRPEKNMNPLNGVTTFDLVLISKHILGTQTLDSPYREIAADANGSESITTFDIVVLRRLILQIDSEFPAGQSSWRFVDGSHDFANGTFPFPETVDASNMTGGVDFVGVKIGDVNESASPNQLLGTDTRTFAGDLVFQLDDKQVQAGETFTVDFNAKDFNNTLGYQFTLGFDNTKVDFANVNTNLTNLEESNFGFTMLDEGVITTSWNSSEAVSVEDNATLFSVTFTATETVNISDIVNINSRYTQAEAYNGSDLYNVALAFNGQVATNDFKVYQNTPNPFKEVTTIGFDLPTAATTTVKVFDVSGKVLSSVEVEGVKGYNTVELNRGQLSATGVLYYQVETANHTATMKMILVD